MNFDRQTNRRGGALPSPPGLKRLALLLRNSVDFYDLSNAGFLLYPESQFTRARLHIPLTFILSPGERIYTENLLVASPLTGEG